MVKTSKSDPGTTEKKPKTKTTAKTTKSTAKSPSKTMRSTANRVAKIKTKAKISQISKDLASTKKDPSSNEPKSSTKFTYSSEILKTDAEVRNRDGYTEKLPKKDKNGVIIFTDCAEMRPNLTPKEVLQAGSFGGTYFRPIYSSVTKTSYDKMWNELPSNWLDKMNVKTHVASSIYIEKVNTYGKKCGGSLEMWETSNWIVEQDPYGWFMWYCRYYLGRRSDDDERQIQRWTNCCGEKGRWKGNLIGKCVRGGKKFDDVSVSPVVRQTLQHWGYQLTEKDFDVGKKRVKM